MPHLSMSFLGPFQVTLDGAPITAFHSDKVRALLAYLAVEAERPHRRESLAGLLWPDWPDSSARKNLTNALYELRRAIHDRDAAPPFLHVTRDEVQFNRASDHSLDIADLRALLERATSTGSETDGASAGALEEALSLYRGPFLEGFSVADSAPFEEWSLLVREQLHRQALQALHDLAAYWERRGNLDRALHPARRQVALEPWNEEGQRQVMRLLALAGNRSGALAQYEACRRALAEELGVEPADETTCLYEQIRDGDVGQSVEAPAPARPAPNLPAFLTPLIGREQELSQLAAHLADPACRLLTLLGPGGSGKTRLAVEAAAQASPHFDHGAVFVPLALVQSPEGIVPAIAQAMGFTFYERIPPQRQLLNYLRAKQVLLVLDNFEHLAQGAALITEILQSAPSVQVLATSRASLNLSGEQVFPVGALSLPDPAPVTRWRVVAAGTEFGAVRLFVLAAQRVAPHFELTEDNLAQVVDVCRQVQGMPLGILLAASWARALSPEEISTEIGHSLDFLDADWRDLPERQRSMRAVFDHSWRLLSERQQAILRGLAVFRGSFAREAAQAVTGATLRDLIALVDQSLLHRTAEGRYELHELLRAYAGEKLSDTPDGGEALRDRHCAYYAAALEGWFELMQGPRHREAVEAIEANFPNARAAWTFAAERRQSGRLLQAAHALGNFCRWRARRDDARASFASAADRFAEADRAGVSLSALDLRAWSLALAWQSVFPGKEVLELARGALSLLDRHEAQVDDTRAERAFALMMVGFWSRAGDAHKTKQLLEQSVALFEQVGLHWNATFPMGFLSAVLSAAGDHHGAAAWTERQLTVARRLDEPSAMARALSSLMGRALLRGDLEEVQRLFPHFGALQRQAGMSRRQSGTNLVSIGNLLAHQGRFEEGIQSLERGLAVSEDLGDDFLECQARRYLCEARPHLGQYSRALTDGETALALARQRNDKSDISHSLLGMGRAVLGLATSSQGRATYVEAKRFLDEALRAGRESRWAYPKFAASAMLLYACLGLDQADQARPQLLKALEMALEAQAHQPLLYALPAAALLLVRVGQAERAVELYALPSRDPFVANSRWFEDVAGKHIAAAAQSLPPDVVAAAQARGRTRDLWETARELTTELTGSGAQYPPVLA